MAKSAPSKTAAPLAAPGEIDLKDPVLAAVLAWLIPGAGHWYQGRRTKAVLFFVCILGTFLYGLHMGDGRVVYASWRPADRRFAYFAQFWVGLPALPAIVQAYRVNHGKVPLNFRLYEDMMAPPSIKGGNGVPSELDRLNKRLNRYWEFGTTYTMVAGLLNVLAIYDAFAGPAESDELARKKEEDEEDDGDAARGEEG